MEPELLPTREEPAPPPRFRFSQRRRQRICARAFRTTRKRIHKAEKRKRPWALEMKRKFEEAAA